MNTLLLLEKPVNPGTREEIGNSGAAPFRVLPFMVLPAPGEIPPEAAVVARFDPFPEDQLHLLQGIDWLLTQGVDVVNLSLGPSGRTFDPDHPLQVATRLVHGMGIPMVVAAGNRGPGPASLQPLARAPWVIAVGATDSEGTLLDSSGRGSPDGPQPAVVADGSLPDFDPRFPEPATSFAAPKVAGLVAWIQKILTIMIMDLSDHREDKWLPLSRPVRLPVVGTADTGVDPEKLPPLSPLASSILNTGSNSAKISRSDREYRWYDTVMKALDSHGLFIEVASDPDTTKRMLQQMARPMPGYAPEEVGAGFISLTEVERYLTAFTPSRFIEFMCPGASGVIPQAVTESLDRNLGPLWDEKKCAVLRDLFYGGIRVAVCKVV